MARTFGELDGDPPGPGECLCGTQHALTSMRLAVRRQLPAEDTLKKFEELRAVDDDASSAKPGTAARLQRLHHNLP